MLESLKDSSLYVGFTRDLRSRVPQHNEGLGHYTKRGVPWKLIHYEAYLSEKDALRREKYLKTNQGARLLKLMLREYFQKRKDN